jgi:glucosamine-6-phosphate deaminase
MKISVHESAEAACKAAAETAAQILKEAIARRGQATFIAATGGSQIAFLKHLVAAPGIAWDRTTMFHLDEYVGLPATHPGSFRRFLRERLTSLVPIGGVHFIDGDAPDLRAELMRLNHALAGNPVDAAFIGIGENGHLAFNDPPADFETECPFILVALDEGSRRQQLGEGWFKTLEEVPRVAISMSVRQIMKAASIVCTVPGKQKAKPVKACLEGEIGPMFPASILRRHPRCFTFLDRDSAGELSPGTLTG